MQDPIIDKPQDFTINNMILPTPDYFEGLVKADAKDIADKIKKLVHKDLCATKDGRCSTIVDGELHLSDAYKRYVIEDLESWAATFKYTIKVSVASTSTSIMIFPTPPRASLKDRWYDPQLDGGILRGIVIGIPAALVSCLFLFAIFSDAKLVEAAEMTGQKSTACVSHVECSMTEACIENKCEMLEVYRISDEEYHNPQHCTQGGYAAGGTSAGPGSICPIEYKP